jgi:hypothetical protein
VDIKFERLLGEVRLGFQEVQTDIASFKGDVGTQLAAMPTKADARSNMQWIIGTLAALIMAMAGPILTSFQTGVSVAVRPPRPSPAEVHPKPAP